MNLVHLRDKLMLESIGGEKSLYQIYKGVRKAGGTHEHALGGIMSLAAYHSPLNNFNEAGIIRMVEGFRKDFEGDRGMDTTGAIDGEFTAS